MNTLLLVDGSSYLYRAFHAMPDLRSPSGQATGAIYGVLNMLRQLKNEYPATYQACIFDAKGKTFRDAMYPEYKANRPPMPEDLRSQVDIVHQLVAHMGWHVLVVDGVEADDVIGTLASQADQQGMQVIISTGDKDMAQLVTPKVSLINTMSKEFLDEEGVKNKFGVRPDQIIDYLALMGDKVDNVPGVEKCGPKTAVKWLEEFNTLDGVINHADQIKGKVGENLKAALDFLPLARQLVTIKCDVDLKQVLPKGLHDLYIKEPNWPILYEEYQQLGFKTWTKEAQQNIHTTDSMSLFDEVAEHTLQHTQTSIPDTPIELHYQAITTQQALTQLLEKLDRANQIGLDTETTSLNTQQARIIGLSMAFAAGDAVYIPLAHSMTAATEQLPLEETLTKLKPYLESTQLKKIGQNLKYDQHIFANHGIQLKGIAGDSMLASYVVESHLSHGLDDLAPRHLGLDTITYESLCGKGAKQISFADVSIIDATPYACQDADFALRLEHILRGQMNEKQRYVYEQIELPVASILFMMERLGVLLDKTELARQSHELGQRLLALETQAHEMAGQPFNLNSPKQLQEILFERLAIPIKGLKKTASGGISTDESVLEKLALDYPLPKLILENRTLAKLKTTYTDKLPSLISPNDGRVHTTYAQAVAITGRLASNNPNLQNIPIRTEEGRRVRKAFIAPENSVIISADYSQIELRIMAHLSNDPALVKAFNEGADIHRATAAEVFHVEQSEVTSEQRRYAKTINFGLIYGMGQYGLASSLEISPAMAKQFIDRYFMKYPAVAGYMEEAKLNAQEQGFVETLFGRRLYLPDIHSPKANIRAGAERAAINAPMQGTASDLIKLAMIAVQNWLEQDQLNSKLIMQVHDELVLEVPPDEITQVKEKLPELMAGVATLNVPLLAEVGIGQNWEEAH
ncbi:DNA polymerase I [Neisseria sp. Ec49-e6-T10]|uniref:DNA polymerase I n=1 Tax=Neisseria sp. Ec49-e6-T10 TaxID=3140744 RepID=UPI003EB89614